MALMIGPPIGKIGGTEVNQQSFPSGQAIDWSQTVPAGTWLLIVTGGFSPSSRNDRTFTMNDQTFYVRRIYEIDSTTNYGASVQSSTTSLSVQVSNEQQGSTIYWMKLD